MVNFSVEGKGYVGLGFKDNSLPGNELFCYDPATEKWTQKKDAPLSGAVTSFVSNGFVYLLQGHTVWRYDPASDTYVQKNDFPGHLPGDNTALFSDSVTVSFVINGEAYLISGSDCWKYNVSVDNWQQKASLPASSYAHAGFSLNNYGYVLIDSSKTSFYNAKPLQLWQYNPLQDQWLHIYDDYMGKGTLLVKTATLNGRVYAGFGYNANSDSFPEVLGCDFWIYQ